MRYGWFDIPWKVKNMTNKFFFVWYRWKKFLVCTVCSDDFKKKKNFSNFFVYIFFFQFSFFYRGLLKRSHFDFLVQIIEKCSETSEKNSDFLSHKISNVLIGVYVLLRFFCEILSFWVMLDFVFYFCSIQSGLGKYLKKLYEF